MNQGGGYPGWWDLKAVSADLSEVQDKTMHHATSLDFSLVLFYCTVCQSVECFQFSVLNCRPKSILLIQKDLMPLIHKCIFMRKYH